MQHGEARLRNLPECLEEFSKNSVDEEASASSEAPASISRETLHLQPTTNLGAVLI